MIRYHSLAVAVDIKTVIVQFQ